MKLAVSAVPVATAMRLTSLGPLAVSAATSAHRHLRSSECGTFWYWIPPAPHAFKRKYHGRLTRCTIAGRQNRPASHSAAEFAWYPDLLTGRLESIKKIWSGVNV
jgi:hypothetical protein